MKKFTRYETWPIPVFAVLILSFLMVSCPEGADYNDPYGDRPSRVFWAQHASTDAFYKVDAVKLAEGTHCVIWVERSGRRVSEDTAKGIAWEYDTNIYQKMMDVFGFQEDIKANDIWDILWDELDDNRDELDNSIIAHNTLELADWFGDGDGKLAILLLDIKDGYRKTGDGHMAGYFWSGDFVDVDYSNLMDMMYMDTYPSVPGSVESYITFVHELQHLMNFVTSTTIPQRVINTSNHSMDAWIEEGLSSAAEYVYLERHEEGRDNSLTTETIARGNNFFVWDNHSDKPQALLDDYATVYLFFYWLRLQSNGIDIYKDIIKSPYYDYQAVTAAAAARIDSDYNTWGKLLGDWMAANYINAPSGRYGYPNDPFMQNLKIRYFPGGTSTLPLYPGEGVYSYASDSPPALPIATNNIKYTGLGSSGPDGSAIPAGGALLTYNINIDQDGATEDGQLTNKTPPPAASINADTAMSRSAASVSGSYVIDARDMLRRNGHEGWELPNFGNLTLPRVRIDAAK